MIAPRPTLVEELDALFCGLWPGRLRELFDPEAPRSLARRLGWLLGRWTGRLDYLKALRNPGPMRYGIDGEAIEPACREHEIHARQQIYRTKQKRARRKAQRAAEVAQMCRANAAKPTLRLGARP